MQNQVKELVDVEGSVMRKVINAGLDPHRWFAGVMYKFITPDLSQADNPEWVKNTKEYLKANVTDAQRQNSKMAILNDLRSWPFRERSLSKKKVNCWKVPMGIISSEACGWTDRPPQERSEVIPQGSRA